MLFSAFFTALVLIVFCPRLSATAYAESSTPETAVTTYTVTYHANGGCWWSNWSRPTYSFATKKYEQEEGKTYQIIDSKPTYGANTFNGWNTESDGSGTWYSPHQNMSVPAIWTSTLSGSAPFLRPPLNLRHTGTYPGTNCCAHSYSGSDRNSRTRDHSGTRSFGQAQLPRHVPRLVPLSSPPDDWSV